MKRLSFLNGLPVIMGESGVRIGRVSYVRLDQTCHHIEGIGIRVKGIFPRRSYVPNEDIGILGDVSVIVRSKGVIDKGRPISHEGKRVISADGELLGWMTNVLIDDETGTVEALEVSRGFIDDLMKGRLLVSGFTIENQRVVAGRAVGFDPRLEP